MKKNVFKLNKILKESEEQEILVKFLNDLKKVKKILDFHTVPNENYLFLFYRKTKEIVF